MAGTFAGFDETAFREGVLFAMGMGAPPDPSNQAQFLFPPGPPTYRKNGSPVANPRLDREGNPLDPDVEIVRAPGRVVSVPCAVEIVRAEAEEVPVGNFRPTKAVVTLLDSDYQKVVGCRELAFGGDRYGFNYTPDTLGMFGVGIFQMIFFGISES